MPNFKGIFPELEVAVEDRIHNTAKRNVHKISCRTANGAPAEVIGKLKKCRFKGPTVLDGVVRTLLEKGLRETTHPVYQVMS